MKTQKLPIRCPVYRDEEIYRAGRGYEWKVVVDPTRNGEEAGFFYGRLFRMIDIRLNRDEKSTWPDGIVFQHIQSECRLTYQNGILLDLTHSRVLRKKPKVRVRSRKDKARVIKAGQADQDLEGETS